MKNQPQYPGMSAERMLVSEALAADEPCTGLEIMGWVRTRRDAKGFSFLEINDGSCLANLQVVVDEAVAGEVLKDLNTGAAVALRGDLVASPAQGQRWELRAAAVWLLGQADPESYPLQKKRHSDEFLRSIAHLRPRTNKFGALTRIRSEAAFAVHEYFRERGFNLVHTPILTGSDCEGGGELFRVSTCPPGTLGKEDFFDRPAYLTVSGQLPAEALACALGRVYTFGPTFRAENSNTPRHAAEFWMIEPEMAFADLTMDMDLAEEFLKTLVTRLTHRCAHDLALFVRYVDQTLPETWAAVLDKPFVRLPHAEAVRILKDSRKNFEHPVHEAMDLQTEHERFLTEEHFKQPVIVYDWPKEIKAFYMRLNDDGRTVAAMDVLLPRVGEIIGGSQREERLDALASRLAELNMQDSCYDWYMELRRFGTVPHAGFGMGFERFLMMLTGVANIRDVIAFPRTPGHLEF